MSDNSNNKNLQFWEVVAAVVFGLAIFQWFKETKDFPWWIIIIIYVVIAFIIEEWKEKRFWKEHNKKKLEFVKSNGFDSWDEYMEINGMGENVRESYKEGAKKERAKRQEEILKNLKKRNYIPIIIVLVLIITLVIIRSTH